MSSSPKSRNPYLNSVTICNSIRITIDTIFRRRVSPALSPSTSSTNHHYNSQTRINSILSTITITKMRCQDVAGRNKYSKYNNHHTLTRSMLRGPSGPACRPHMYRMRRVLPQPVSPITITGMLHLQMLKLRSE